MPRQTLEQLHQQTATTDPVIEELEKARRVLQESEFGPSPRELVGHRMEVLGALDPQAAFGTLGREPAGLLPSLWRSVRENPLMLRRAPAIAALAAQPLEEIQPATLSRGGRALLRTRIQEELAKPNIAEERLGKLEEALRGIEAFEKTVEHKQRTLEDLNP